MMRKPGISGWKLIICVRSCVVSNEMHPLLALKLTQMKIVVTGKGLEHPLANPSPYLHTWKGRISFAKRRIKVHPRSMGNDAMSKALRQISKSPFTHRIDKAKLPHRFTQPAFTIYNGKTDPVEHVSHFN